MSVHMKKREVVIKNGRNRASRSKSFVSKEAAEKYATENGIKSFTIVNSKPAAKVGKFKIVS